ALKIVPKVRDVHGAGIPRGALACRRALQHGDRKTRRAGNQDECRREADDASPDDEHPRVGTGCHRSLHQNAMTPSSVVDVFSMACLARGGTHRRVPGMSPMTCPLMCARPLPFCTIQVSSEAWSWGSVAHPGCTVNTIAPYARPCASASISP